MQGFLTAHPWFINGVLLVILAGLALLLVWGAMALAGIHIREFFAFLRMERNQHKKGEKTIGALNWRCVRFVFAFGILTIAALEFEKIMDLLTNLLGQQRGAEFYRSADITTLFWGLVLITVISVLSVYAHSRK